MSQPAYTTPLTHMALSVPSSVKRQHQQLCDLMNKDDKPYVRIEDLAKLFGSDPATFRRVIYNRGCSFAIGMEGDKYGYGYSRVPKLAVWNFFMQGALYMGMGS